MAHRKTTGSRAQKALSLMGVVILLAVLLSACGSNPPTQANASTNKANLDKEIAYAQSIGVPASMLNPIISQEDKVSGSSAPLTFFSDQPATQYYANQASDYQQLSIQLKGLDYQATQQSGSEASRDLNDFSSMVAQRQNQGYIEAKTFSTQLNQVQIEMNQAKLPKDYTQIIQESTQAAEALRLMGTADDDLTTLNGLIKTMDDSNIDTTALKSQSSTDLTLFRKATTPTDFNNIINQIGAQITSANTITAQAIPYVGQSKLSQFQATIESLKSYGGDTSTYETMYNTDKSLLSSGKYTQFASQINQDTSAIKLPLLKLQATQQLTNLVNATKDWGHTHQFYDSYNGQSYDQAYEYWNGTLYDQQENLANAQTAIDYQAIISDVQQETQLFNAEKADYGDKTPIDQPHQSDLDLMKYFGVSNAKVIVTSLIQDQLRVYQNGNLVQSFPVVSGMPDKPTPPGFTQIFHRQSPAVFKPFDTNPNSPFWYAPTKINYAMEYHDGEYYYHDSWWRASDDYGLGKKYPHYAPNAFNSGTHGCINMSLDNTAWLWHFTQSVDSTTNPQTVYSIVY